MGSLNALAGNTIYLDANLFIYAIEGLPPFAAKLVSLFQRFDRGELHAVTSELTLAEVLVKPRRDQNNALCDQYERMLRPSKSLTIAPVTRAVLIAAAAIRANSSLKLPDAIHAATALTQSCTTYLTNDQQFKAVAELPVLMLQDLV
jgi:predicted nucleic acid-binding protein